MKCASCNGKGDVEDTCHVCNGSGEGRYDGSRCRICRGDGIEIEECTECKGTGEVEPECEQCFEFLTEEEYESGNLLCLNCQEIMKVPIEITATEIYEEKPVVTA